MSAASELIERIENETGCRIDNNDGDNIAMTGLIGAIARFLGQSKFGERDDVATGLLIRHRMSPAYQVEQKGKEFLADLMIAGFSPDTLKELGA